MILDYETQFTTGTDGSLVRTTFFDKGYELVSTKNRIKMFKKGKKVKFIKFIPGGRVTESVFETMLIKITKFIRYGKLKQYELRSVEIRYS